jgi:predicted GIY-YIG superfamily endonuclease
VWPQPAAPRRGSGLRPVLGGSDPRSGDPRRRAAVQRRYAGCGMRPRTSADVHAPVVGVVYLLHFDRPYRHARHYLGWTSSLPGRVTDHANGRGARLVAVITASGIGWQLARTWTGDRNRERQLKRQGGASRRCPVCGVTPRGARYPHLSSPMEPAGSTTDASERIAA